MGGFFIVTPASLLTLTCPVLTFAKQFPALWLSRPNGLAIRMDSQGKASTLTAIGELFRQSSDTAGKTNRLQKQVGNEANAIQPPLIDPKGNTFLYDFFGQKTAWSPCLLQLPHSSKPDHGFQVCAEFFKRLTCLCPVNQDGFLAPMSFGKFDMSCPDICQIVSGPVALSAKWPGHKNGLSSQSIHSSSQRRTLQIQSSHIAGKTTICIIKVWVIIISLMIVVGC